MRKHVGQNPTPRSKKDISVDQLPSVFPSFLVFCKLTDFSENRSTLLQKAAIILAKTMNLKCGTEPYMAQEILLEEKLGSTCNNGGLKGNCYLSTGYDLSQSVCIINPEVEFLYEIELSSNTEKPSALAAKYL